MKLIKFAFFQLSYFLIIFAPIWRGMDWAFITASIFLVYGFLTIPSRFLFASAKPFYILIFLFLYIIFNAFFTYEGFNSSSFIFLILKPLRIIITAIGCYVLIYKTQKAYPHDFVKFCIFFVLCTIFLHSLIMNYESINPNFRSRIQKTLFTGQNTRGTWNESFRMGGLMGIIGGAILSVVQSTGILCIPFMMKLCKNIILKGIFLAMGLSIFYSILVCGRSGLWSVIIFLPLSLYLLNPHNSVKWVATMTFACMGMVFILSFAINYTNQVSGADAGIQNMLSRTLDSFINYNETGQFEDKTVNTLSRMILLPKDGYVLFLGDPTHLFNNSFERTLRSDIGYIRDLWSMGIFGLFVYMSPYIKMAIRTYRNKESVISILAFILLLTTLFFHMKEMFLYCRCLFPIIMLIYHTSIIQSGLKYKKN